MPADPQVIARNLARIRERVGPDVEVLAAVKYVGADELPALAQAGVTLVGENRTDALAEKQAAHGELFTWDFIGHLQSRKVRELIGRVRLIHSLDSLSAAEQLQRRSEQTVDCLLQVNMAGEDTKSGLAPADVDGFLEAVAGFERLRLCGLMTMPPAVTDPEAARPWFSALRELRDRLAPGWSGRHPLTHLSMGTSQDYGPAADEGATIVRVGGVLFTE